MATDIATPKKATGLENTPLEMVESQSNGLVEDVLLKQRFSLAGVIGIQLACVATPLAIGSYISLVLGLGGNSFFFWTYCVAYAGQMSVCLSLAEIASVFPHTLGQIYWTAALSPAKWKRLLSYLCGVATTMELHFTNAATFILASRLLAATITVFTPANSYTPEKWHLYLIVVGLLLLSMIVNIWTLDAFAKVTTTMAAVITATVIFLAVALLVRSTPKQTAHDVFLQVVDESGWGSLGVVFLLGLLPGSTCIAGFDFASHLTEELPAPERNVPLVMLSVAFFGGLSGLIMVIVFLFCTVNPAALLTPIGGMAIAQLCWDALRSRTLTGIVTILYSVIFVVGSIAIFTPTSRVMWSFSKHRGYILSERLGHVDPKTKIPINAVVATTVIAILLCLLVVGPETAMNALFSSIFLSTWIGYGLPIWLLVIRGRRLLPDKRYVNLGRFGLGINVVAVCWQLLLAVFVAFPSYLPITPDNMNYAAPMFVGIILLFLVDWTFYTRKRYVSPSSLQGLTRGVIC